MPPFPTQQPSIPELIPALEPDIPAAQFAETPLWPYLVAGAVALLAGALLLVWLLLRRRQRRLPLPKTPVEVALETLAAIGEELPALRECSLRVSLALRTFLAGQMQDPALFETHEEFSRRMDSLAAVPAACREKTARLLDELAQMKYTPQQQTDPLRSRAMVEEAQQLVNDISEARAREAAEKAEQERRDRE